MKNCLNDMECPNFDEDGFTDCPKCLEVKLRLKKEYENNPNVEWGYYCSFCNSKGKVDWLQLATSGDRVRIWEITGGKICKEGERDDYVKIFKEDVVSLWRDLRDIHNAERKF